MDKKGVPATQAGPSSLRDGAADASPPKASVPEASFQSRVEQWMRTCFPPRVVADRLERRDRLIEESLELAQTLPEFTAERAHALVDYVFNRPIGLTEQEVGGVSVTLTALCIAEGIDQAFWAEAELARINKPEIMEKIRAKQAAKPTGSALPIAKAMEARRAETLDSVHDSAVAEGNSPKQCKQSPTNQNASND